jgi:uncharacterized HAD superfamily protein
MRYCFDLDGTLCTQVNLADNHGEDATLEECYKQAEPIQDRIDKVNELFDSGFTIIIATARASGHPEKVEDWMSLTEKQLKEWGVKHHILSVGDKVHADLYIDDRSTNASDYFK